MQRNVFNTPRGNSEAVSWVVFVLPCALRSGKRGTFLGPKCSYLRLNMMFNVTKYSSETTKTTDDLPAAWLISFPSFVWSYTRRNRYIFVINSEACILILNRYLRIYISLLRRRTKQRSKANLFLVWKLNMRFWKKNCYQTDPRVTLTIFLWKTRLKVKPRPPVLI